MGSCGESAIGDDPSGGSGIAKSLCPEVPTPLGCSVQESCSEEACDVLGSNVDLPGMTDGCVGGEHVGSASLVDAAEGSRDALADGCENADVLRSEKSAAAEGSRDALADGCENADVLRSDKTAEDGCQNCLENGDVEVSCLKGGELCSEDDFGDEVNFELPSESMTTNNLQKECTQQGDERDDMSSILPSAVDDSAVMEGNNDVADLLADAFNGVFDFRHSEVSLESESMADILVDCNQKNEPGEVMRNEDTLSMVVEKCDASDGMEIDACRQMSPSQGMEVLSGVSYRNTKVESTSDELCAQKDGVDLNSTCEEKIEAVIDNETTVDSYRTLGGSPVVDSLCDALDGIEVDACWKISPSQEGMEVPSGVLHRDTEVESTSDELCAQNDGADWNSTCEEKIEAAIDNEITVNSQRTLGSSPVVHSLCEPTLLGPGSEMKNGILQIEDNSCELNNYSAEGAADSTCKKTFYPESGQPSAVLITNISSKDVPDLLSKSDDVYINDNRVVDNPGQTNSVGKEAVEVDCIIESEQLPSLGNTRRTKSGRKTPTKKASRKCKNKVSVIHPGEGMKINLDSARKKRSCLSKPARSSIWGLLGNIKQFFQKDNELEVSEAMCRELGKPRSKRQNGRAIKSGASSSSLSLVQKQPVSTSSTRVRLKIKFGKEIDLSCSNVLTPEAVGGLASAAYLGSDSGSQRVASNAEDKFSEVVALSNLESLTNDQDKNGLVLDGQIANGHLENTERMEKSDGGAEEPCLTVLPEKLVEALVKPIDIKVMDPGTSPDSEVINSVLEVQVGERHEEDVHHSDLGSSKEFNSNLDVTISKRRKKKDKLIRLGNCITEDGSQDPPGKNRAKHSKNHRCKKNCSDAVNSLELPTSTEISKSLNNRELSTESLPLAGVIELGGSTEALKVEGQMEVKAAWKPSIDHGFSEPHGSENLLSSAKSMRRKLPKSLTSKVGKAKSKASESTSRKRTTSSCKEKQNKPICKSEVKGEGLSLKVKCEAEDHPHPADVVGNHKMDAAGNIDASDNISSVNLSNLDMLHGGGLGEQPLSPRNAWVSCDNCHKWRRIPAALADQIDATNCTWTCKDSSDKAFADCAIPQEKSNAEINAELGLSEGSGEEDVYERSKNYKELEYRPPLVPQQSTFTRIFTNEFLHRSRKTQTIDEIMVCHCKPSQEGKSGCGDECLNRMLNIECVQGTCPCGGRCSNQQFQKRKYASLRWFKSGRKGYGLKAVEDVSKGQFLIEYVGEVLDMHAYEARQREYALKGHRHFYFMTLNGSEVIDASAKGNLGRFINHSCEPNCRTEKWMVNGEICIGLFALKKIKKGEELTFDYNYVRVFGAAAKKCYCGSPRCRGYIGGGDPLDDEMIVQGDSDEEFPEPVMLTEDGEIEESEPDPRYFDNVDTKSSRHLLKDSDLLDKSTTAEDANGSPEKESSTNPASSAVLHSSVDVKDLKVKLSSSVQMEEISQQMEDTASKPLPAVQEGCAIESECADKTSSIKKLETTSSHTTVSKVLSDSSGSNRESKSEIVEGRNDFSQSPLPVDTPQLNGSVKKGKVRANPANGHKAELTATRLQVSSKHKKVVEGSSNGRFEAVQAKLNELLDGDGGISKRKDATKGYLKLLLLTVASGNRSNGEGIQSNRDLSMILDALLKTKSRAVLNDIINKNGLQMLHNIMKQYRLDFKKIPILRKLLKVLEFLAANNILTSEHIYSGPPCHGMESFRKSMLSLTEHDDKQVHQIARSFRDRWIRRSVRKPGYMDRDDNRLESHRSLNCNRFSASNNHRHEQDSRPSEANDCGQQSMLVTTSVDGIAQEGSSTVSPHTVENNGAKKRKRKSRWDQPAETNSNFDTGTISTSESQSIHDDVPPGFSHPMRPLNASLNSGDPALQNASHSGFLSDFIIGRPKERFNSRLPVSYGMPLSVAQQYGTPHAETIGCWFTAPGLPFNPFPPLPPYPRVDRGSQPSDTTTAMAIDQPAEVQKGDTGGLVNRCLDDMIPSTTGSNPDDVNLPGEGNQPDTKRLKADGSNDLGKRYFRQQKWNNSKIHRPWFKRDALRSSGNNSSGDLCSVGVDVTKESKGTSSSEDAICRDEKGANNI